MLGVWCLNKHRHPLMSQVIGQVWREVVGCRNWPVMRVPQFIALQRNEASLSACRQAATSSLGLFFLIQNFLFQSPAMPGPRSKRGAGSPIRYSQGGAEKAKKRRREVMQGPSPSSHDANQPPASAPPEPRIQGSGASPAAPQPQQNAHHQSGLQPQPLAQPQPNNQPQALPAPLQQAIEAALHTAGHLMSPQNTQTSGTNVFPSSQQTPAGDIQPPVPQWPAQNLQSTAPNHPINQQPLPFLPSPTAVPCGTLSPQQEPAASQPHPPGHPLGDSSRRTGCYIPTPTQPSLVSSTAARLPPLSWQ